MPFSYFNTGNVRSSIWDGDTPVVISETLGILRCSQWLDIWISWRLGVGLKYGDIDDIYVWIKVYTYFPPLSQILYGQFFTLSAIKKIEFEFLCRS